ncbi:MAG: glucose-6-phosphate dehydrogenase [Actinomycetota bacterium]|nr:glucose-6-phosphate dehydrogenase [Actinomycetota bacterium]
MATAATSRSVRRPDPNTLVIFGASGDLTSRKLIPALYQLLEAKLLPEHFAIVGFSRTEFTDHEFRDRMHEALKEHLDDFNEDVWKVFSEMLHYIPAGDHDEAAYRKLKQELKEFDTTHQSEGNRLFYLATPPEAYAEILELIGSSGMAKADEGWTRIVIEKPFGRDLESAIALDETLHTCFDESQIFRIDHYLGKETVQNLFVLRFANGIAEPVWNRRYVDSVQITVAEELGVEHRAQYYDSAGAIRDMLTNHLLQLLALTAMEPPVAFESNVIRDEKVKVLHALEHGSVEFVRGQYRDGTINRRKVPSYHDEPDVPADSRTETFVAVKCFVENWRWAGVPFFLRTGKRMKKRASEIVIQFKHAPFLPFQSTAVKKIEPNRYVIRIQPDEGAALMINAKVPGPGDMKIVNVPMTFDYDESFRVEAPEAYLRLLLDAMLGDATLFTRSDEVRRQWMFVEPLLSVWGDLERYPAGSWGPAGADELLERDGRSWHVP